jgi:hypothetical protein
VKLPAKYYLFPVAHNPGAKFFFLSPILKPQGTLLTPINSKGLFYFYLLYLFNKFYPKVLTLSASNPSEKKTCMAVLRTYRRDPKLS